MTTHPQEKLAGAMLRDRVIAAFDRFAREAYSDIDQPWGIHRTKAAYKRARADAIIPIILKEAAGVVRQIYNDWEEKVRGDQAAGNYGPYLGTPGGEHVATAIERLGA